MNKNLLLQPQLASLVDFSNSSRFDAEQPQITQSTPLNVPDKALIMKSVAATTQHFIYW